MNISPEITSAIITFFGTCLIGLLTFYITTHRGSKVILRKIRESSLVKWSTLIDGKLSFTYNGKPIDRLKLYEFELTNEGYIDIENFEVTLDFEPEEKSSIIEIQVTDKQDKVIAIDELEVGIFKINRPYFNMVKKYKDERLAIQIFTDTNLKIAVSGGGKGWGVKYQEYNLKKRMTYFNFIMLGVAGILAVILVSKVKDWFIYLLFMGVYLALIIHDVTMIKYFTRRNL